MSDVFISNSCVGWEIYRNTKRIYNSPFIGTLIPNDDEYLKLCTNFRKYIHMTPIINVDPKPGTLFEIQNGHRFYKWRPEGYPIIHLGDVEIHCIHEKNKQEALEKFNRRCERCIELLKDEKTTLIFLWSFSEFFNDHPSSKQKEIVKTFLSINETEKSRSLFLGPTFLSTNTTNYIVLEGWDSVSLRRNNYHVFLFNNQPLVAKTFIRRIKS